MHLIGCNLLQINAKMEVSAKQTSLTSHQILCSVHMLRNDADVQATPPLYLGYEGCVGTVGKLAGPASVMKLRVVKSKY